MYYQIRLPDLLPELFKLIHVVQQMRKQLDNEESNRWDERLLRQYWNAQTWQTKLNQLISAEYDRDGAFQRLIYDLQRNNLDPSEVERQYCVDIDTDIKNYQQIGKGLDQFLRNWHKGIVITSIDINEVVYHRYLIWKQYYERRVYRAQLDVQRHERLRRLHGQVQRDNWDFFWGLVQDAWVKQEKFFRSWYPRQLAPGASWEAHQAYQHNLYMVQQHINEAEGARLQWCKSLRAYQEMTRQKRQWDYFDFEEHYIATREVDAVITRLEPPKNPGCGIGGVFAIGIVIIVVIYILSNIG